MPKNGNSAEKLAARRVQNTLDVPYVRALRMVQEHKRPTINWGQAADRALEAHAGPGLFPEPDDHGDEGGQRCSAGHLWDEECAECAQ